MKTCTAYIVQANRNETPLLCVMDPERGYFSFDISVLAMSRLAMECSERVNVALGAPDMKAAGEEIATLLSSEWGRRGPPSG